MPSLEFDNQGLKPVKVDISLFRKLGATVEPFEHDYVQAKLEKLQTQLASARAQAESLASKAKATWDAARELKRMDVAATIQELIDAQNTLTIVIGYTLLDESKSDENLAGSNSELEEPKSDERHSVLKHELNRLEELRRFKEIYHSGECAFSRVVSVEEGVSQVNCKRFAAFLDAAMAILTEFRS